MVSRQVDNNSPIATATYYNYDIHGNVKNLLQYNAEMPVQHQYKRLDYHYDLIFAKQVQALGRPGDILLAISTSGNSPNILRAVDWANRHGLKTFGLTGFRGGKLRELAQHDVSLVVADVRRCLEAGGRRCGEHAFLEGSEIRHYRHARAADGRTTTVAAVNQPTSPTARRDNQQHAPRSLRRCASAPVSAETSIGT